MAKFFNIDMADLAHQLTLSPRRLRMEHLDGVEKLLAVVAPGRSYPFDFVCYGITGYRKRGSGSASPSIPGKALISDLVTLAEVLSRKSNLPISLIPEPYKTHEDLAEFLRVSTKTIRRWRSRGLMGLRVVFDDGVNRLIFCKSSIDRFVEQHKELVEKGASFRQLTREERREIVERARELVSERPLNLHAAAKAISQETQRAVETVRYTLRRYDESHRAQALFTQAGDSTRGERQFAMWRCHRAGESCEAIGRAFECTTEEVRHVLLRVELRQYKDQPIEFVHNELFDSPSADALILDRPEPVADEPKPARIPNDLPSYLRSLYMTPLLSREQERVLFCRYNYVKYKARRIIDALTPAGCKSEDLEEVRALIKKSEEFRQRIIQANLRLVVGIAKKHVGWSPHFFEIISDGNMSLMRAVEKFDYSRGNKFSTYATWAIMKNYARSIPEAHYHAARYVTGQDVVLDSVADERPGAVPASDRRAVRALIEEGMEELTEREREIVTNHFGLSSDGASVTLEQLGKRFGVTKERVRQIERKALARLRDVLAPSLVETFSA